MLYCDALSVKKMVPLDKLVSADPCLTCNYERCPIYVQRARAALAGEPLPEPLQHHTRRES